MEGEQPENTNLIMTYSFDKTAYLQAICARSLKVYENLQVALNNLDLAARDVHSIYAAGSVGRLEINDESDVDGVVVLNKPVDETHVAELMSAIETCYEQAGLKLAKTTGIYRQPIAIQSLLDAAQRGSLTESPDVYGKRIQLLLDARPLYAAREFRRLQTDVLNWFMPTLGPGFGNAIFLMTEIKRYYSAYSAWQYFKFGKSADDGWLLRQAKLKITRTSTMTALILLLGARSDGQGNIDFEQCLSATPLERILRVFDAYADDESSAAYLAVYEAALQLLGDQQVRRVLIEYSPASYEEINGDIPNEFDSLCEFANRLSELTTSFILKRTPDWSAEFYRQCFV